MTPREAHVQPGDDAVARFRAAAAVVGWSGETARFPAGTRTAVDAAAAVGCELGAIVKSLVFQTDRDEPVLVLTSGVNRVDLDVAATHLGTARLVKADPDRVRAVTGFAIGGTPPFGHRRRLRVLVDRDLLDHETVWAAAGAPDAVFAITPADLVTISGGEVVTVAAS